MNENRISNEECCKQIEAEVHRLLSEKNSDPQEIQALSNALQQAPDLYRQAGDLALINQNNLLGRFFFPGKTLEVIESSLDAMRAGMDYENSPALEQMLIQQTLLNYANLNLWEAQYIALLGGGLNEATATFIDRHIAILHQRYLRSSETLARVRRLASRDPSLQINIATHSGKQVNFAGSLINPTLDEKGDIPHE